MALFIVKIAIFGIQSLHVIVENEMHPQRVPGWCGFWARGIIGQYFFENEAGQALNDTGVGYHMITQFFLHKLYDIDVDDTWF